LEDVVEGLRGEAEAIEPAWDLLEGDRPCHLFLVKWPPVIKPAPRRFAPEGGENRVVDVETVVIGYAPAVSLEQSSQVEEPQGLGPEVIGGKVVDPRVDQEKIVLFSLQRPSSMVLEIVRNPIYSKRAHDNVLSSP
jgi:hypothetical protein